MACNDEGQQQKCTRVFNMDYAGGLNLIEDLMYISDLRGRHGIILERSFNLKETMSQYSINLRQWRGRQVPYI